MLELLIKGFILLSLSFGVYKVFLYIKRRKSEKVSLSEKIEIISNNVREEVIQREDKPYYDSLKVVLTKYPIVDNNKTKLPIKLIDIDNLYVNLKLNLRSLDEFEEFQCKFNYKKRKYRQIFNKSTDVVELMESKYTDIIKKYLISFNGDFNSLKENEINSLNKLVKESKVMYNDYDTDNLKINLKEINRIHQDISIKIDEPARLRDKLLKSEDNINQLETELINIKGSLYHKVLDIIKNNKVTKEDTEEWNRIKRTINNFIKSNLLKNDVIESSDKLNKIIQNLSNLSDKINKEVISEPINVDVNVDTK